MLPLDQCTQHGALIGFKLGCRIAILLHFLFLSGNCNASAKGLNKAEGLFRIVFSKFYLGGDSAIATTPNRYQNSFRGFP